MGLLVRALDKFSELMSSNPVMKNDMENGYSDSNPSISDKLAITEFSDKHNVFLLEDGISVASAFELGSIAAENTTEEQIQAVFQKILDVFSYVVDLHEKNPWVMQIYVNDEFSLEPSFETYLSFISDEQKQNEYTKAYLERLKDLYSKATRKEGLLHDPVTGGVFRGRNRRIRATFYRRYSEIDNKASLNRIDILKEHIKARSRIRKKLKSAGLDIKLLTGSNYYNWFVRWFNPKPRISKGDIDLLIKNYPYEEVKQVANFNFAQNIFYSNPKTEGSDIYFDELPHRVLFFDGLAKPPIIGRVSREMEDSGSKTNYALLDKLPEGSVYTMQVVFSDDSALSKHLKSIENGTIGSSLEAKQIRADIQTARDEISIGNRLYWVSSALYIRGEDEGQLDEIESELVDIFGLDGGMPISPSKFDIHPIDSYLSALPFNFNYQFFKKHLRYDRLMYAREMAALLPVYGRNQGGKGMGCIPFFNRIGEPVYYDPISNNFVSQNSHMAIFATSGAGKSVLTGHVVDSLIANHNAIVALFEMGDSFGGMVEYAKSKGKKVKQLRFVNDPRKAVAINPFANWKEALKEINVLNVSEGVEKKANEIEKAKAERGNVATDDERDCGQDRSYMTEMALALRTMLTQANEIEEQNFSLADETLVLEVLTNAITHSYNINVEQMVTEHVVHAFERRLEIESSTRRIERIEDFRDRLKSYVIGGKSKFFNVPTKPLDDFDLFHIDVQSIQNDIPMLSLVMISLLPRIIALAEKNQDSDRPMYLVIDEAHLQLKIPVIVDFVILVAKVARKLGLWLCIVTQNVTDLKSDQARKIITLCENFILLKLSEDEIQKTREIKPLTDEQINLIRGLRTVKGVFSEAMMLNPKYQGLFRIIPPRRLLAILQNNQEEKRERRELTNKYGTDKAIEMIAARLESVKDEKEIDDHFVGW